MAAKPFKICPRKASERLTIYDRVTDENLGRQKKLKRLVLSFGTTSGQDNNVMKSSMFLKSPRLAYLLVDGKAPPIAEFHQYARSKHGKSPLVGL
jgi:hypothetical protein